MEPNNWPTLPWKVKEKGKIGINLVFKLEKGSWGFPIQPALVPLEVTALKS